MMLLIKDRQLLIRLARERINRHLLNRLAEEGQNEELPDSIRNPGGVFVSLYVDKNLRGCIGTFSEAQAIYINVQQMALSAASQDTRFAPIQISELGRLKIEISVLSPRKRIQGPEEIVLGRHGIFIQHRYDRGTLLPQVALKQGWTVEQFLGNCAKYKAGLDWDGWKDAELFTFEALVFDSDELDQVKTGLDSVDDLEI
jgi:AmmeMemoRadiSam system protein A